MKLFMVAVLVLGIQACGGDGGEDESVEPLDAGVKTSNGRPKPLQPVVPCALPNCR